MSLRDLTACYFLIITVTPGPMKVYPMEGRFQYLTATYIFVIKNLTTIQNLASLMSLD